MSNWNEKVNFIWSVADLIRDKFSRGDYQEVILPFTVLRRIDQVLEPTKDEVLEAKERYEGKLDDPSNIASNLKQYLTSFSPNMRDVLSKFDFDRTIDRLDETDLLYQVVEKFTQIDLHPSTVSNHEMGRIFVELMQESEESFEVQLNQEIAEHLGKALNSQLVETRFDEVEGKTVCAIEIQPSDEPVYYDEDDLFVRRGSQSMLLKGNDRDQYVNEQFIEEE